MTATMPGAHPRRATLLQVAAVSWVLLISAIAVINYVSLVKLPDPAEASTTAAQITALEQRVAEALQYLEHERTGTVLLPQARYDVDRQTLDRRLMTIEQSLTEKATADGLVPLQTRIQLLEARLATRTVPRSASRSRPEPAVPVTPAEPPFRVTGTERRADERFLAIVPVDSDGLADVRLLRPGEEAAGWRLTAIEGEIAVFQHGAETRRLAVPKR